MLHLKRPSESGFTLIELMVSLFLGVLLILGIFNVLINSNTVSRSTKAGNDVQESGRFAMEFLTHEVNLAGSRRVDSSAITRSGLDIVLGTLGNEAVGSRFLLKSTKTIQVKYPDGVSTTIPMATVNNPRRGTPGEINGDVLAVQYFPPNRRGCDGQRYPPNPADDVTQRIPVVNVYWVRSLGQGAAVTSAGDAGGSGSSSVDGGAIDADNFDALYCLSLNGNTGTPGAGTGTVEVQPLVLGVQAMELQMYNQGAATPSFQDPASSIQGTDVSDVRIGLLLRSKLNLATDPPPASGLQPKTYTLMGETYTVDPGAGYQWYRLYRQVYTSSGKVFNQGIAE